MKLTTRWARIGLAALLAAGLLGGCGVRYATVKDGQGRDLMLLGHDPVAYFTLGKPTVGDPQLAAEHEGVTYYFVNEQHRSLFRSAPQKYQPQYGGFCSSGAAYAVKLGSDPTEWTIRDGRLFIFGDILGHEAWDLDPAWNVQKADEVWPEASANGHISQSLKRFVFKVSWYKNGKEIQAEWQAKHPGQAINYDPGGMVQNLFLKYPGWRAREGYGQPALGIPGVDACPPACVGATSQGYKR